MKKNMVSVVIPCYNAEQYVGEAVESALRQTYEPKEIIVIDDGSTDGSLEEIRSFGDRITWRAGENRGAPAARNQGLSLASGEFVKFLDADDVLLPEAVATQVRQAEGVDEERAIVYGDADYMDPSGKRLGPREHRPRRAGEDPLFHLMENNIAIFLPLHRRAFLREVDGFDERLPRAQEYDLHLRLCLAGIRFRYMPADVGRVRQHEGENRITNRNHFQADPQAMLDRIRRRERLVQSAREDGLSERISQYLAQGAWSGGRAALRNGHPDVAQQYFDYARNLHPQEHVAGSSRAYRWCVRLFGPRVAEHTGTWMRRLKSAKKE